MTPAFRFVVTNTGNSRPERRQPDRRRPGLRLLDDCTNPVPDEPRGRRPSSRASARGTIAWAIGQHTDTATASARYTDGGGNSRQPLRPQRPTTSARSPRSTLEKLASRSYGGAADPRASTADGRPRRPPHPRDGRRPATGRRDQHRPRLPRAGLSLTDDDRTIAFALRHAGADDPPATRYTCEIAIAGGRQHTDTATASASYTDGGGNTVNRSDTDNGQLLGATATIDVEKLASVDGGAADLPGRRQRRPADPARWHRSPEVQVRRHQHRQRRPERRQPDRRRPGLRLRRPRQRRCRRQPRRPAPATRCELDHRLGRRPAHRHRDRQRGLHRRRRQQPSTAPTPTTANYFGAIADHRRREAGVGRRRRHDLPGRRQRRPGRPCSMASTPRCSSSSSPTPATSPSSGVSLTETTRPSTSTTAPPRCRPRLAAGRTSYDLRSRTIAWAAASTPTPRPPARATPTTAATAVNRSDTDNGQLLRRDRHHRRREAGVGRRRHRPSGRRQRDRADPARWLRRPDVQVRRHQHRQRRPERRQPDR